MPTSRVLVPLLLCLCTAAVPALADETVAAATGASAQGESSEPDAAPTRTALVPAAPRWSASAVAEHGGYRWSLTRGALDLGLRFAPRAAAPRAIDARSDSAAPLGATLPSISFGLRTVSAGPSPADSLIERALGADGGHAVSKIGIEWKPAQSQVFFHRGIGFRLSDDDRLVMRLRKSSIGIYMHRTF